MCEAAEIFIHPLVSKITVIASVDARVHTCCVNWVVHTRWVGGGAVHRQRRGRALLASARLSGGSILVCELALRRGDLLLLCTTVHVKRCRTWVGRPVWNAEWSASGGSWRDHPRQAVRRELHVRLQRQSPAVCTRDVSWRDARHGLGVFGRVPLLARGFWARGSHRSRLGRGRFGTVGLVHTVEEASL